MRKLTGIIENPEATQLRIPIDGILKVSILYEVPESSKESVTNLTFRVTTTSGITTNDETAPIRVRGSTENLSVNDIVIEPIAFTDFVLSVALTAMRAVQTSDVIYRKINITSYNSVNWFSFERTTVPQVLGDPAVSPRTQIVGTNSNIQENQVYKFKCSTGVTGLIEDDTFVQRESVSFRCYVRGMEAYGDKPSRFLVLGTNFKTNREVFDSSAMGQLQTYLTQGVTVVQGTATYLFVPIFLVAGFYRPCVIAQIEGIKAVAGTKARKMGAILLTPPVQPVQPVQPVTIQPVQPGSVRQPRIDFGTYPSTVSLTGGATGGTEVRRRVGRPPAGRATPQSATGTSAGAAPRVGGGGGAGAGGGAADAVNFQESSE